MHCKSKSLLMLIKYNLQTLNLLSKRLFVPIPVILLIPSIVLKESTAWMLGGIQGKMWFNWLIMRVIPQEGSMKPLKLWKQSN